MEIYVPTKYRRQGAGWYDKHSTVHKPVYTWLQVHFNTYRSAICNPNFLRLIYLKGIGVPRDRCLECNKVVVFSPVGRMKYAACLFHSMIFLHVTGCLLISSKIWKILYYHHPPSSHVLAQHIILQYGRGNIDIELSRYLYSKVSSLHIFTLEIIPEVKALSSPWVILSIITPTNIGIFASQIDGYVSSDCTYQLSCTWLYPQVLITPYPLPSTGWQLTICDPDVINCELTRSDKMIQTKVYRVVYGLSFKAV